MIDLVLRDYKEDELRREKNMTGINTNGENRVLQRFGFVTPHEFVLRAAWHSALLVDRVRIAGCPAPGVYIEHWLRKKVTTEKSTHSFVQSTYFAGMDAISLLT